MNNLITFPAQSLVLFRETVKPVNGGEPFTVVRGELDTLPLGFGYEGFKPCVRIYGAALSPEVKEQLKALKVKTGVCNDPVTKQPNPDRKYTSFGRVTITAAVDGVKDFQTKDGVACKEYRLAVQSVTRDEGTDCDDLFA